MSFSIPAPSSGVAVLASFRRSWHSHIPFGLLFNFQGTVRRSFTYSHWEAASGKSKSEKYLRIWKVLSLVPTGKSKIIGCFWKIFCFTKDPFTHLDKGGRNAHPFLRFSKKNFYSVKISPHLFGITKPNDTLFRRKNEKIFFLLRVLYFVCSEKPLHLFPLGTGKFQPCFKKYFAVCKTPSLIWNWEAETHPVFTKILKNIFWLRALILLAQKVPSLIPTENSQMHPLNLKKILSLHLFGIGMPKRNLFFRKNRKNFLKRLSISKTSPHLFPSGEGFWGLYFWKKAKNLPAGSGGCKCQRKSEPGAHEKVSHKRPRKSEPERSRIVDPVC